MIFGLMIMLILFGYLDLVDRGVICQWGFNIIDIYFIQYCFVFIDFNGDKVVLNEIGVGCVEILLIDDFFVDWVWVVG